MFADDQYTLLDFGQGRRLERFGRYVLDRPAPAATGLARQSRELWRCGDARFERASAAEGRWTERTCGRQSWRIRHGSLVLTLKLTDSGAVGVFPEQAENWDWIERQVQRAGRVLKVLNLFAYTGGSTLAAAAAGAEVVHVDAARSVVAWARQNAQQSGLAEAPVRWIVEDVRKFVARELRRGSQYDAVILDPPTYGHGPRSQAWKLERHLPPLLDALRQLTHRQRSFMLLSCHAPGVGPAELEAMLAHALCGHCQGGVRAKRLTLARPDGTRLESGVVARWSGRS